MDGILRQHSNGFVLLAPLLALGWAVFGPDSVGLPVILVLTALALILGLPHGALDLFLAKREGLWRDWRGFMEFHAAYLAIAGVVVALFVVSPVRALIGFLVLSVTHFAEDWKKLPRAHRIAISAVIVLVPSLAHPGEVASIFSSVAGREIVWPDPLPYRFHVMGIGLIVAAFASAMWMDRRAGSELGALVLLAWALPPLVFFAAYFCFLHGPRHLLRHQEILFSGGKMRLVLLYTGLSLAIVIAIGIALGQGMTLGEQAMRMLFVGLAALSTPHALLIEYSWHWRAPRGMSATEQEA